MDGRRRAAVWWLGLCQCLLWGALYYSFGVLLVPLADATGQPLAALAGGFSIALLVAAFAAPAVGRRVDRGQAVSVFRAGIACAVIGLVTLAMASPRWIWPGWLAVGLGSALVLYEPAFGVVIRAFPETARRARSLAVVTVLGGLASTLCAPAIAAIGELHGARHALLVCAAVVLACGVLLERAVLPALKAGVPLAPTPAGGIRPAQMRSLMVLFATGTAVAVGLVTLLVPVLVERGSSPTDAAWCLGVFGLAQLPGRVWLASRPANPSRLMSMSFVLQGVGLLLVAPASGSALAQAVAGVALFGLGAGLQTVARPWVIERIAGPDFAGRWNGELARAQGLARAAMPVVAVSGAALVGSAPALLTLAMAVFACLPVAQRLRVG